jgi:hypothetical protein
MWAVVCCYAAIDVVYRAGGVFAMHMQIYLSFELVPRLVGNLYVRVAYEVQNIQRLFS